MRNCTRVREELLALVEGELPARQAREADEHIARCLECASASRELRDTLASLRSLPAPRLPDTVLTEIRISVRRRIAREAPLPLPLHHRVAAWLWNHAALRPVPALSAAVVLGLLLAVGLARGPRAPQLSPTPEVVAVGDALPIAQNLDVLEQFELLVDLDLLEQLPMLRVPGDGPTHPMS